MKKIINAILKFMRTSPLFLYLNYFRFGSAAIFLMAAIYNLPWLNEVIFPAVYNFESVPFFASAILAYSALFLLAPAYILQCALSFKSRLVDLRAI